MKRTLCVVGLAALTWVAPAAAQSDHLKCYKVKDPQAKILYTADLGGLVAEPGCRIKVPAAMACVPASKTNVTPPPPGGGGSGTPNSFFCYKVKCPRATLPMLAGADQFGSRTVTPSTAKLVCAPLAGPSTTTTVGATTTTSTTTTAVSTTTTTLMSGCALPATGQTTCWDSSGTVIPCAGTGQDGESQKGAPLAYTDNGDGTITDNHTGLVWEKQSMDGSVHDVGNTYAWANAFAGHVATLNTMSFAGHADWRLPNSKELASILNLESVIPSVSPAFNTNCTASCTVLTCSCTASSFYWSSSTDANSPSYAWGVSFYGGSVLDNSKGGFNDFVRGVRGGS